MAAILKASSPELKGQLTWNLVGSIRVASRSKIAKIVPIRNQRWPPWLPSRKFILGFFSWTKRPIALKLGMKHRGDLLIKKKAKIVPIRNPRWQPGPPFWNFKYPFSWIKRPIDLASSPEQKGQLTWNLVWRNGVDCGLWLWHSLDFSLTLFCR